MMPFAYIPSPPVNGFSVGPLFFHFYGIMYVLAVAVAIFITRRRWANRGGDPDMVYEAAKWGFPAGLVGGRIYFDITTPSQMPQHWWGPFAIWDGGLGIWGGIAAGVAVALWRLRKQMSWTDVKRLWDTAAPSLLVAQAIGRIGNYFNQELYGKPSKLPWALEISPAHRRPGFAHFATYQPTFLYELIWDLLLAAFLIWLSNRRRVRIKTPGIFALYVAGYSAFRIFEETLRIDYSEYILGMRLNFWVAILGTVAGLVAFVLIQRHGGDPGPVPEPGGAAARASAAPEARPTAAYSRPAPR
jgi:prolipoprotein diacylglyceryl transferase